MSQQQKPIAEYTKQDLQRTSRELKQQIRKMKQAAGIIQVQVPSAMDATDIRHWEESLRVRSRHLDTREAELNERERLIVEREKHIYQWWTSLEHRQKQYAATSGPQVQAMKKRITDLEQQVKKLTRPPPTKLIPLFLKKDK